MKQPHTEKGVRHTDGQQNTGNHKKPSAPEAGGADRFGGTRAGAGNVESPAGRGEGKDSGRGSTGGAAASAAPEGAGVEQAGRERLGGMQGEGEA